MIQNLRKFLKDIADAIREKKGTSELIKPIDFAEEIKGITAGGSGESGDSSNLEYLDVSGIDVPDEITMFLGALAKFTQTKFNSEELAYKGIADAFTLMKHSGYDGVIKVTALAMSTGTLNLPIKVTSLSTGKVTDEGVAIDVLDAGFGGLITQILNCPRITKEQFYDLNTLLSE